MTHLSQIFLVAPPGLEAILLQEVQSLAFDTPRQIPGGVLINGGLADVYRANLSLRGCSRVLLRVAEFRVGHLAQLDKRARKIDWQALLRPDVPVAVEVTCRKSKIYHSKAAAQRIEGAISATTGVQIDATAALKIKARIDDDLCTISIDTSGEGLHKRGLKGAVGKAPIRETLAALCLRACGFSGQEPVLDPMCGSGTFVIEAAEIAANLTPGRARSFAFESLKIGTSRPKPPAPTQPNHIFYGFDRDSGAITSSKANAATADVSESATFTCQPISDLTAPDGQKGLVMINPPYGGRIGNRKQLFGLYGTLGKVLATEFQGWRVGMVTSDPGLAKATNLTFKTTTPFDNGGLKVALYQTDPISSC